MGKICGQRERREGGREGGRMLLINPDNTENRWKERALKGWMGQ